MQGPTIKKVKRVTAYVAGGVLVCLGLLGLLNELGEGRLSSTNFFGYGLAVLLIASGVLICLVARSQVKRVGAYLVGGTLVFLGLMGLLTELEQKKLSSTNFSGYVRSVVLIASGALTWVAARFHYGGGLWSLFGLICSAAAFARFVSALQVNVRGRHLSSPEFFYSTTALLWGVGCYCLIWGHMRHHRQKKNSP